MSELQDRLRAALAGRYTIERELGHGGMALVFLAQDLKHHRPVAIKVLRPELAAALGAERFLREIETAARLNHPHILPLHDSGEADGFLYYVMPYVEGESLRDRLTREQQLPLEDALQIAREVASALSYAHSHDVVHRDIKPENILLEGGEAVVADFGIARAITAAGGDKLTETGLTVGTPSYMSPEQAAGERHLDGRSDIYSLGCVLYEMLAGEPPFTGPTAQAILARRLTNPVPPLRTVRETVPVHVEQAIARALAKVPADRFPTAAQFADTLSVTGAGTMAVPRRAGPPWRLVATGGVLALAAVALYVWRPRSAAAVDPNVVAIVPFRVSGADPALRYLREGMIDLLAAKLTGEGGPRAADPRSVVSAWRRGGGSDTEDLSEARALEVAARLGAGRLLLGSVVGTPSRLAVSVSLVTAPRGRVSAVASVDGPPDSLPVLIDRLTAQLLAREAREVEQRLTTLTTTSLPALRAYLDGQTVYRRGQYSEAAELFNRALELDSSFALAALGRVSAKYWTAGGFDPHGVALAWAYRDRLSERDRALAVAFAGPRYPEPLSWREQLVAFQRATELAPDRPEPWYWLGETYYHQAPAMGLAGSRERAAAALRRAVALDSTFAAPVVHLVDLAASAGDTGAVRSLAALFLALDSAGDLAEFVRWRVAVALADTASLAALRGRLDRMTVQTLRAMVGYSMLEAIGLEDADRAIGVLERRADTPSGRFTTLVRIHDALLNRGRPGAALRVTAAIREAEAVPRFHLQMRVLAALFGDGDSVAAAAAVRELAPVADAQPAASGQPGPDYGAICAVELWRVAHGRLDTAERAIARLKTARVPGDERAAVAISNLCAPTLEALIAAHERRADANQALARLDSLLQAGLNVPYLFAAAGNFTAARLCEAQGDLARALSATRRRVYHWGALLTTHLREEGRLAALLGDRETAVHAYQHYLALRSDPEPALKPEVERVRAKLARLVGEPSP